MLSICAFFFTPSEVERDSEVAQMDTSMLDFHTK